MLELKFIKSAQYTEDHSTEIRCLYNVGRYNVITTTTEYIDREKELVNIQIDAVDGNRFTPYIYYRNRNKSFAIGTTSYGSLPIEDIKRVIEGYNEAVEVVEILTNEFIK